MGTTWTKFEELNVDLFRKTLKPVEQVLKDANVKKEDIDDVNFWLVGRHSNAYIMARSFSSEVQLAASEGSTLLRECFGMALKLAPRTNWRV
jgi:hypothetical protein